MKKYDIKTTDTETLKKWYHLMVLGRALDEKLRLICCNHWVGPIMRLMRGMTESNWP